MTRTILPALLFAALLASRVAAGDGEAPSCVTHCHGQEREEHQASVHVDVLTCIECHGGDPTRQGDKEGSHDPAKGFTGKIPRTKVPELCGTCHADPLRMHAYGLATDPLVQYRTSVHGRMLFEKDDTNVAVCIDCHGVHGILPAQDPRAPTARVNQPRTCGRCHSDPAKMGPYGLPSDSVERFVRSAHGDALLVERSRGAPSCADCHGSHGAVPPGIRDLVQACGQCHAHNAEQYRKSPHYMAEDMRCVACHDEEKDSPAYAGAQCTACHLTHEIAVAGKYMFSGDEVGHCGHCHRSEDDKALVTARTIVEGTDRLDEAMERTREALAGAKDKGLVLEHEETYLRESERALVFLEPLSHSLDLGAITKHLEDGLKRQDRTREELDRKARVLRDRRLLLSGMAGLLLLLAALCALKLQAIRRLS